MDLPLRASNEGCIPTNIRKAAGMVSTARIERPPFYRGGSASTETMPAALPSPPLEQSDLLEFPMCFALTSRRPES